MGSMAGERSSWLDTGCKEGVGKGGHARDPGEGPVVDCTRGSIPHSWLHFYRFYPWHDGVSCLHPISFWSRFLGYEGVATHAT